MIENISVIIFHCILVILMSWLNDQARIKRFEKGRNQEIQISEILTVKNQTD